MKCLILAGGLGLRMGELGEEVAKPLLPLGSKLVIDYIVESIPEAIDIIVSTNQKFEFGFRNWLVEQDREIDLVIENPVGDGDKIGACSAIDFAIRYRDITENLVVIGGDNLFTTGVADFFKAYNREYPLVGVYDVKDPRAARGFGVITIEEGRIVSLVEKPAHPESSIIATACYAFPPRVFHHIADFCSIRQDNLGGLVAYLVDKEGVYPYYIEGEWFDVGTPDVYKCLQRRYSSTHLD